MASRRQASVQAVIDNFSRYVLAWKVSRDYGGVRTKELIVQALLKAKSLGMNMVPDQVLKGMSVIATAA